MEETLRTLGRILFAKDANPEHHFVEFAYWLTQRGIASFYKDKVLMLYKRMNQQSDKEPNKQEVRVRLFVVEEHNLVYVVCKDFLGPIEHDKMETELDIVLTECRQGVYSFPLPTFA